MKKTLPTTGKARSMGGWCKHLRRKGTRRLMRGHGGREAKGL